MYLLGYDIGSSSIKVALVNAEDGSVVGTAQHPDTEMPIMAAQADWAEQNPEDWWDAACVATQKLLKNTQILPEKIAAIGIAYQMHGLVLIDKAGQVLRPAIIWCDSRAVSIGNRALEALGASYCLGNCLNAPGNFTASKLRWVAEQEPECFAKIDKAMLPGDYIAYRMTGLVSTTISGLSEGVFWDFKSNTVAKPMLDYFGVPERMLPECKPTFAHQGSLSARAAAQLGLVEGIAIGYRAGDQPNNALSLNVLNPGEVAATGGTSGVVYAVAEGPVFDPKQRVNSFAHVNYSAQNPLTGVLLCINGAGSLYRWVRENMGGLGGPLNTAIGYPEMEQMAATVPIGAEGLSILPFGNGAERMLGNQNPGAQIIGLQFNRHEKRHLYRAALEGIAFAFVYGMEAMREMGIPIRALRAGNDNLFQSAVFSNTVATLLDIDINIMDTTGATGAAKAAGVSVGLYASAAEAMAQALSVVSTYRPSHSDRPAMEKAYQQWRKWVNEP